MITAIVTGGASGIGAATARRIIAGGGRVGVLDLNVEAARALAQELGASASFAAGDVLDMSSSPPAPDSTLPPPRSTAWR